MKCTSGNEDTKFCEIIEVVQNRGDHTVSMLADSNGDIQATVESANNTDVVFLMMDEALQHLLQMSDDIARASETRRATGEIALVAQFKITRCH